MNTIHTFEIEGLAVQTGDVKNSTWKLDVDFSNLNRLVVFVIGQTRYTTLPASYRVEVGIR